MDHNGGAVKVKSGAVDLEKPAPEGGNLVPLLAAELFMSVLGIHPQPIDGGWVDGGGKRGRIHITERLNPVSQDGNTPVVLQGKFKLVCSLLGYCKNLGKHVLFDTLRLILHQYDVLALVKLQKPVVLHQFFL